MFSLFNHRFDNTPIVSVPTLGKVFIAWCTKNKEGDWEVEPAKKPKYFIKGKPVY